jgi:hypothetical protein
MGEMITRKALAIRPVSPSYHGDRALQCRRPDLRSRLTPLQSWQLLHAWHASGSNDTPAGSATNMISGPAKTELTTAKADKISKKRIEVYRRDGGKRGYCLRYSKGEMGFASQKVTKEKESKFGERDIKRFLLLMMVYKK